MIVIIIATWLFVAAGWYRAHAYAVKINPEAFPGHGRRAMIVAALAWPFLVTFGALAVFAMFLGALRR